MLVPGPALDTDDAAAKGETRAPYKEVNNRGQEETVL